MSTIAGGIILAFLILVYGWPLLCAAVRGVYLLTLHIAIPVGFGAYIGGKEGAMLFLLASLAVALSNRLSKI